MLINFGDIADGALVDAIALARIAPWQLWLVDFGRPVGHERGGLRPAIVVGSATHCRFPIGMALVVPLTTRDRGLEHHVRIASAESGLHHPSWARTEEITAVSTGRFSQPAPIGTASAEEIAALSDWLRRGEEPGSFGRNCQESTGTAGQRATA